MKDALINAYSNDTYVFDRERIQNILWIRYQLPILEVSNWPEDAPDPYVEYRGYDIESANAELQSTGRLSDYAHREQTWQLLEKAPDGEHIGEIDSRTIPAINESTDDLLREVQDAFGGKYSRHETEDGDTIKLRIADHSGKHRNNTYCEECISIVIANDNVTGHFRSQGPEGISNEHYYDDTYTAEEIIAEIKDLLNEYDVIYEQKK